MAGRKQTEASAASDDVHFPEFVLLIAFFLSGATGLSLEVAWSKELSYLLGVDIYATTTVVTAFMAGLGLGALLVSRSTHRIPSSIRTYGFLQWVIGLCALISIPLFRMTLPLFSFLFVHLGYDSAAFLLLRFLVVFGFMLIPVTLMGMTLPVVVGASYRRNLQSRYAYLAGKLYGINTLGAVMGTLTAGFLLIPAIGILRTCLATGAVDIFIGTAMLWLSYDRRRQKAPAPRQRKKKADHQALPATESPIPGTASFTGTNSWPAAVFLLSGISALSYEIIWFRLLARIIGPSVHAFSIMLAIYLLGLAAGSLAGARIIRKSDNHRLLMAVFLGIVGFAPLLTLFFINRLPLWYGMLFIRFTGAAFSISNLLIQTLIAALLILPATLALGAFFPVVTRAYNREPGTQTLKDPVGRLYFYNTVGSVIGSLAAGFWLVPAVGIKASLLISGGLNIVLALAIFLVGVRLTRPAKAAVCMAVVTGFSLVIWASPGMNQKILNAGLYSEMLKKDYFSSKLLPDNRDLGHLLFFKEGINNSVAVVANKFNDGNLTLHLSGSWEASTEIHGRLHLKFLGHLPMLFARNTETVGVIGFGAGITTGTVLLYPDVRQVNVFELEPAVIEGSHFFEFVNNRPLSDPRLHLYMVDGRSHITYGGIRYDVITSDPIHPYVAGASNLYTYDSYRIMAEHLNPGGVFCQWIPLVGMSAESYNTILNSMHRAFPHLAVFSFCGESVIVASRDPLRIDWETLEKRFNAPNVYADLKMLDVLSPYNLADFFMGAEESIDHYLKGMTRINTDDNVWLEHRIPFDIFNGKPGNLFFMLQDKISAQDRTRSLAEIFPGIPLENLDSELAALKKEGDKDYARAQQAYQQKDFAAMEKYLRGTLADFNSRHLYPAGIQLMQYLADSGRTDDIFPVAAYLEKNFPAFPEAYVLEARAWEKKGDPSRAEETLKRGRRYLPDDLLLRDNGTEAQRHKEN